MDNIQAVAFDIDGTLYSDFKFYLKIFPYFIKRISFFYSYSKTRSILHRTAPLPDFFEYQARLLAENLMISSEQAKSKIQTIIYDGMKPYFKKIKPFKGVEDFFIELKNRKIKIGILSDFPPEQKGDIWGLAKYCDVIMGSEECGALKPSIYTFGSFAQELGVDCKNILYVGNSIKADIKGAKNAGMKTAYLLPLWRKLLHRPLPLADISFKNYRQLSRIVLN